jgi:hypothetical protein
VRVSQEIVQSQRAQALVAERNRNDIQETLQGLHVTLSEYIRENRHIRTPYGLTHNAAEVLQSVEQVSPLLRLRSNLISYRKSMPCNILFPMAIHLTM